MYRYYVARGRVDFNSDCNRKAPNAMALKFQLATFFRNNPLQSWPICNMLGCSVFCNFQLSDDYLLQIFAEEREILRRNCHKSYLAPTLLIA